MKEKRIALVVLVVLFGIFVWLLSDIAFGMTINKTDCESAQVELDEWVEDREIGLGVTLDDLLHFMALDAALEACPIAEDASAAISATPESTSFVSSVYRGMGNQTTDVERWRALAEAYFPSEVDLALCVMKWESGGNPDARNTTSGASGLWQVMPFWADSFGLAQGAVMLYEPGVNAWVASEILRIQGWTAWSAYNRGKC